MHGELQGEASQVLAVEREAALSCYFMIPSMSVQPRQSDLAFPPELVGRLPSFLLYSFASKPLLVRDKALQDKVGCRAGMFVGVATMKKESQWG